MKKVKKGEAEWLDTLRNRVYDRPITIFRFSDDEWWDISNSVGGTNRFTVARSHSSLERVRAQTASLVFTAELGGDSDAYLALLSRRSAVSTLDSRVTLKLAQKIAPSSEEELLALVTDKPLATILRKRLAEPGPVVRLSPALSVHIIDELAKLDGNRGPMRRIMSSLDAPQSYSSNNALQQDAVSMALRAFGIPATEAARSVEIVENRDTALARVNILEDAVIEHDARSMPPFLLAGSDLTGRAVFEHGTERLEVITANKRPLEEVLGVDFIYFNVVKKNIVMVQYKMLDPNRRDGKTDWLYRPNKQLKKEMTRMKRFSLASPPGPYEYRINPQVFYLKFVRRDAQLGKSAITIPIDHYEILRKDPACRGPKGAFRISYETLDGRYMRQGPFLDLIRSGYIGAHAETTENLKRLVDAILSDDHAVVAAVHSQINRTLD